MPEVDARRRVGTWGTQRIPSLQVLKIDTVGHGLL
jgi:hypothetical protein